MNAICVYVRILSQGAKTNKKDAVKLALAAIRCRKERKECLTFLNHTAHVADRPLMQLLKLSITLRRAFFF